MILCARTPDLVNLLERDFHKCLVRTEAAFCSNAALVPGGGWIEAACVKALEEARREGRELGLQCCEWSSVHGPPWMGPLCFDYRDVVIEGVMGGLQSYLTTLANNVCAEGSREVEAFLRDTAEFSGSLPGVLDLIKVKVDAWTKAVDFVGLTNRRM